MSDRYYRLSHPPPWAKKDIFKEMLKGRKFKKFPDGWSEGLVDAE